MKAPEKIFVNTDPFGCMTAYEGDNHPPRCNEYIRKDIHDETIKTAEDHAYFAGTENMREDLLEWAKECYKQMKNNQSVSNLFKQGALYELEKMTKKIKSL